MSKEKTETKDSNEQTPEYMKNLQPNETLILQNVSQRQTIARQNIQLAQRDLKAAESEFNGLLSQLGNKYFPGAQVGVTQDNSLIVDVKAYEASQQTKSQEKEGDQGAEKAEETSADKAAAVN